MWRRLCSRAGKCRREACGWKHSLINYIDLSCDVTLNCGQSFAWKKLQDEWVGVIGTSVIALKDCATTDSVQYKCVHPSDTTDSAVGAIHAQVHDYFRMEVVNLDAEVRSHEFPPVDGSPSLIQSATLTSRATQLLVDTWREPEDVFSPAFDALPGLRTLRQDPVECLFSFICSSNNNISRIQQLVNKLRVHFGDKMCSHSDVDWYAFPTVDQLKAIDEADLRSLGFGYRAQFIVKSATILHEVGGTAYLDSLRRHDDPAHVQTELQQFAGVGRKVADCVALFSLDKLEAIPIDTHVWQIACRDFHFKKATSKSLTPRVYAEVAKLYQDRFEPFAGWAHSVLFAADLAHFKPLVGQAKRKTPSSSTKVKSKKAKEESQRSPAVILDRSSKRLSRKAV
ncbi:Aste57867_21482 [Aphanomyces stellatus]|uniref:DNA-(apurinic or apyrimidinic site) lyase n=1 Tax=Aphanomyces stellatus TaxID=120398 RepID=A0A485LHN7_9STRA|nr:hypothetical protein As57867_021413 [Aphanomyces stellatus]VFT98152.1 Aste57867_21482 [Aphanomyces stellatus]